MKTNIIFIIVIAFVLLHMGVAQAQVIVVNKANTTAELSAGQAKLMFLRKVKRLWPETNKPIKPVNIKGSNPAKATFLSKVLAMSNEEMEQYFKQRQFANSETPPTEVDSENQVIDFVAGNEGAIGYVSEAVYNANKDKVKMLCKF